MRGRGKSAGPDGPKLDVREVRVILFPYKEMVFRRYVV